MWGVLFLTPQKKCGECRRSQESYFAQSDSWRYVPSLKRYREVPKLQRVRVAKVRTVLGGIFGDFLFGIWGGGWKRGGLEGLNLRIAIGLPGKWLVWVLYVSIVYMLAYWIGKYRSYCVFYELAGKLWHSSGPCLRPLRWSCLKSWRRLKSPWSALRGHIWKVSLKGCRRCPALSPLFCLWWMVEMPHWQKNCKVSGLMIFGV